MKKLGLQKRSQPEMVLEMRNSIKTSVKSFTNRMDCVKNLVGAGRQGRGTAPSTKVNNKLTRIYLTPKP